MVPMAIKLTVAGVVDPITGKVSDGEPGKMESAEIGSTEGPDTVKVATAVAPLLSATLVAIAVMAVTPWPTAVATPVAEMLATCGLLEYQAVV